MKDSLPKLPLADWVDAGIEWLTTNFSGVFDQTSLFLETTVESLVSLLNIAPSIFLAIIISLIAWKFAGWRIALFSLIGLLFIDYLGYWEGMLDTLALVLTSVLLSTIIGIPLGIWASQNETVRHIITPLLDFMQTMPAFVYLLPAIFFFNIGMVPGVVASVIFAMPPTIRLTILGIKQVPEDLIEATESFGSTTGQKLMKVQLPLAMPTIMAGLNQSIMLALSMVVIASMVGAPGLGAEVYRAVTQLQIGTGFEAGLAIVIVAIVLDRITQNIGKKKQGGTI
ncbi:glycine betaine/proline transport system permease protein [Oikeobacillus pervagus]|uniref:Glycine betaine/proline transport system permease protein n=1 Tax=Oikeobacillus pervagus TaxID=1325931 RepID=A0AAJ1T0W0_9BACI|nr:proline/glycine betaine ABC transporter permease [Oikeobacillus pervagus]MDQ0216619.1 glycine betaine/proline transport system permease protein [Oikeobacillus pervagus]